MTKELDMSADTIDPPRSRRMLVLVLAEAAALALAVYLMFEYDLGWIGAVAIALLIGVFAVLMFRAGEQRAIATGNFSPAMGRYNRRMLLASLVYVVGLFTA